MNNEFPPGTRGFGSSVFTDAWYYFSGLLFFGVITAVFLGLKQLLGLERWKGVMGYNGEM